MKNHHLFSSPSNHATHCRSIADWKIFVASSAAGLIALTSAPAVPAQAVPPAAQLKVVPSNAVPARVAFSRGAPLRVAQAAPTAAAPTGLRAPQKAADPFAGINVLLVPLDAVASGAAVDAAPAASPIAVGGVPDGDFAGQPPGAAQLAAAPLRRALLRRGLRDVLSAAPDSSVMRRAINDRRVTPRLLQGVETTMEQLVALSIAAEKSPADAAPATTAPATPPAIEATPAAPPAPLPAPVAPPDETPAPAPGETPAIVLEGAPAAGATALLPPPAEVTAQSALQAAKEAATQAAARLGQALNYRAVVLLAVLPTPAPPLPSVTPPKAATYALLVVDALRESGEMVIFNADGADTLQLNENAAQTGGASLQKIMASWQALGAADRTRRIDDYLSTARAALLRGDAEAARAASGQVLALDAARHEAHILMGDALQASDPVAAVAAYRRALGTQAGGDGALWAKIAITHANAKEWPATLKAAGEALRARHDSAPLRLAMATAQFGRAKLFRAAEPARIERAEEAEFQAREHVNRARELAPDDVDVARLDVEQLVERKDFRAALLILDIIAPQHPNDVRLQTAYATALSNRPGRGGEAFSVWARVWKLTGAQTAPFNARTYRQVAEGFDEYVSDLAMRATRLSSDVADGKLPREAALLQVARLSEDMARASEAIKIMVPAGRNADAVHAARLFAADLFDQAFNQHRVYLETGDDAYRARALDLHRQAVIQLNAARGNS